MDLCLLLQLYGYCCVNKMEFTFGARRCKVHWKFSRCFALFIFVWLYCAVPVQSVFSPEWGKFSILCVCTAVWCGAPATLYYLFDFGKNVDFNSI